MEQIKIQTKRISDEVLKNLHIKDHGGMGRRPPEWINFLFEIGVLASQLAHKNNGSIIVLTLPTNILSSVFIATGVLKGSSYIQNNIENESNDIEKQVENLTKGDKFSIKLKTKKSKLVRFEGYADNLVRFTIDDIVKAHKGLCSESVPINRIESIRKTGDDIPKVFKIGSSISTATDFEKMYYGEKSAEAYLLHSNIDCVVSGNVNKFRKNSENIIYNLKLENSYENYKLTNLLKFATEGNARRAGKTLLLSKEFDYDYEFDYILNDSSVVYESVNSWLISSKRKINGASIIIMDRSHYLYEDYAFKLSEALEFRYSNWKKASLNDFIDFDIESIGGFVLWSENESN